MATPPLCADSALLASNTPPKANGTHDADYGRGSLAQGRTAVLEELSTIPVVTLDWFQHNLLPNPLSGLEVEGGLNAEVEDIKNQLISSEAWMKGKGWSAFPTNPGASELVEDKVFQGFQRVVEEIATAILHQPINSYVLQPNTAPFCKRDNKSRPDGCFVLDNAAEILLWLNIICAAEFKKCRTAVAYKDNVAKIIWSLHHVMHEDARRRFTFGITIEDTDTRFWFASRSVFLVSRHFDFMKEPEPLIRMVRFLIYASEEQLGYDTTMRRDQSQFTIDVGGRTFQTRKLLSDSAADSPLGRGTRVWSGFFTDKPRASAVLKDCWVECDRELEGDILATLREQHGKLENLNKPNFDDYFLTVAAHGKITLTGEIEDDTQALMSGSLPVVDRWLEVTDHINNSKLRQSRAASSSTGPNPHHEFIFKRRCHYRIVFNEVGTPLHDVVNLRDYMTALRDTIIAIGILSQLGYVHRDISSGNVLLCENGGRLSDLEYCKPSSKPGLHDVRTGTPNFMSVEVAARRLLFPPLGLTGYSHPPFRYTTLHDIESVWWLLTFVLFKNEINGEPPAVARQNRQAKHAADMFPTTLTSTNRFLSFSSFGLFEGMKDSLPSVLYPLFDIAEALRRQLLEEYLHAEKTATLNLEKVPDALADFQKKLDEAITDAKDTTLILGLEFDRKRAAASSAAKAEEDTGEGDARKRRRNF